MGLLAGHQPAMKKPRAFTLPEILLTAFLLSTVLAAVAVMAREYSDSLAFASKKDLTLSAVQNGLEQLRKELATATNLISPAGAGWASSIEFDRVIPGDGQRRNLPSPAPSSWDPYPPQYVGRVKYYTSPKGALVRQAQQSTIIADNVSGFSAQRVNNGEVIIQCSFREQKRVRTYTTRALLVVRQ